KEIARHDKGSREESNILNEFVSAAIIGVLPVIILPIIISFFYNKISFSLLVISAVSGYLLGLERNIGGILLGKEKMQQESLANFLSFLIIVSPMVLSGGYFNSIDKIFYLRSFALLIIVLLKLWFIRDYFKGFVFSLKLRFFKEEKYYWFGGMSTVLLREVDVLILSFFIDKSLLGAYFLALRIYYAFGLIAEVVGMSLIPFISRSYKGKEKNGFKDFNKIILLFFLFFAFTFSILLLISRNWIISTFFSEFLTSSARYLYYLSFILFFRFFTYSTNVILTSADAQHIRFNTKFLASLLMIGLNIVLGSLYGVEGIIATKLIVELFIFFVLGYFVKQIIQGYKLVI
ncbi:MAG: oligosaccharide flippase family protein, partial [Candidatus Aminicenantes bacterium]|nr:oligosaccharide flippase family protein [Candidatus Aminicenantes bacterium]